MEEWEEASDVSCRSSVISDLDELEANLYSYVHHERNDLFDKNDLNEYCVLPLEEERQNSSENSGEVYPQYKSVGDEENSIEVYPQYKSVDNEVGFTEEKKEARNHFQKSQGDDVRKKNYIDQNCTQDHCNDFIDSRYNVIAGSGNQQPTCLTNHVVPTSVCNAPKTVSDSIPTQIICDNAPQVIDVFSSSDEDAIKETQLKTCSKETPITEVVIIDSDSDLKIEMEKVNVKRKKRKKKKKSKPLTNIMLNTVASNEIICLDDQINELMPETECFESMLSNQQENASIKDQQTMHQSSLCNNWTPQMTQFYNESWGGEYINLSEIQKSMSDNGWNLDISDEFGTLSWRPQDRRYFGNRGKGWCTNCNRKGHFRNACPETTRVTCCYRCGSSKHEESRCNNTICLTCGEKTKNLVTACHPCLLMKRRGKSCNVCHQPGHPSNCCPDLWRRYHATIVPGKAVRPKKVLYKDTMNTYCCNCAKRGHHVYQCKKKTFNDYIPLTPYVISYKNPTRLKEVDANSAYSENWESVGGIAPEERKELKSNKRKNKNEKRGTKRAITHDQGPSNSKFIKLSENSDQALDGDMLNGNYKISTGKNIQEGKKSKMIRMKEKKMKVKQSKDEYNGSTLEDNNTAATKDDALSQVKWSGIKSKVFSPEKAMRVRNYFSVSFPISKNMYKKLNGREGGIVIEYVLKEVENVKLTLVHGPKKTKELVLEGERASTHQAKALMRRIMFNKEVWNTLTMAIEGEKHAGKANPTDLRVEIKNKSLNSRSVTYKNDFESPVQMKSFKSSKEQNEDYIFNNGSRLSQNLSKNKAENAKKTIQGTARTILSEKVLSPEKLKVFADWALAVYGTVLNGLIKYHLRVLSSITQNGKPIKYFRKHLVNVANWHNIPLVGKT